MQHINNLADLEETEELTPGGTLLYGQYTIERHLIDGGFGMTYLARDSLDRRVVIKECFPSSICRRIKGEVRPRKPDLQDQFQGVIRNFLREALRLAKFEHPNIVKVHQVFQENNTAYISMDFVNGMDLLTMLEVDPGRLTDQLLQEVLRTTLEALEYVHSFGMLHRDISPDNLLLDDSDHVTLIDFGAAREDLRRQTRALSMVMAVKDGYSPHEFYYTDGEQDPSSDIYSVGATFYHLITGKAPPDCQQRVAALTSEAPDPYKPLADGKWSFDPAFLRAIDKALSVPQRDRFQSARQWLDVLKRCAEPQMDHDFEISTDRDTPPFKAPNAAAPAHPEIEESLAEVISSLVQDTNKQIDPMTYQKAKTRALEEAEKKRQEAAEKSCLFDIFGNPIEDVDKWLQEQDRQSGQTGRARSGNGPFKTPVYTTPATPKAATSDGTGFGLSRVFSKFSKRRAAAEMMRS